MSEQREKAIQYVRENRADFLAAFREVLSIPSISTDLERVDDIRRAAEWMAAQLRGLGMQKVQVFPTSRHPVVYGEWLGAPGAPTLLLYGHYDVQPADPLDLWETGPFEPTERGENLFARGASDMKGQVVASLKALEALVKTGGLPVNVKWLLEGEEEIGSPSLDAFLVEHKDLLAADVALNPDSGLMGKDWPTITYGLRGLAYFELRVYGPAHDLHSGLYGGIIHNPAIALAEIIAGLHDEQERVTLPGFYDKVRPLSDEEAACIEALCEAVGPVATRHTHLDRHRLAGGHGLADLPLYLGAHLRVLPQEFLGVLTPLAYASLAEGEERPTLADDVHLDPDVYQSALP